MKQINATTAFAFDDLVAGTISMGGHGQKLYMPTEHGNYMVKLGDDYPKRANHPSDDSYRDSPRSEWLGCHVFEHFSIPVQETLLGTYDGEPACACKIFGKQLGPARNLLSFRELARTHELHNSRDRDVSMRVLSETLYGNASLEPVREDAIARYWQMTIVDAIIGNYDRHIGNWGYLQETDDDGKFYIHELAPVYDCGSALAPAVSREAMEFYIENPDRLEKRVKSSPRSNVRDQGRTLTYDMLLRSNEGRYARALLPGVADDIVNLDVGAICEQYPDVFDETYRTFYDMLVKASIRVNIQPAYDLVCREQGLPTRDLCDEGIDLYDGEDAEFETGFEFE